MGKTWSNDVIRIDETLNDLKILKAELKQAGYKRFSVCYSWKVQKFDVKEFCDDRNPAVCVSFEPEQDEEYDNSPASAL